MRPEGRIPQLIAAALLLVLGIAWLTVLVLRQGDAWGSDPSERPITIAYTVADLPVWERTAEGDTRFEPQILVRLIKRSIAPQTWERSASIRPQEETASLIVQQSGANQKKIEKLLRQLRADCGVKEAEERL